MGASGPPAAPEAPEPTTDLPSEASALAPFLLGAASAGGLILIAAIVAWVAFGRPGGQDAESPEPESLAAAPVEQGEPVPAEATRPAPAPELVEPPRAGPTPARPALTTEEIAARSEAAVALIKGKRSSGTGFLVRPGLLATNAHVLEDEFLRNVTVRFPSARRGEQGPVAFALRYEDPGRDLALLEVESGLPPLDLAGTYTFRRGQDVTIIGNPGLGGDLTLENAITRGVMSTRANLDGRAFYQLSISINPGNSGGPVIDSAGQVIGVATLKAAKEEGLGFCIPVEALQAAIAQAEAQPAEQADRAAARHRLVIGVRLMLEAGRLYGAGLDAYNQVVDQALRRGIDAGTSLRQAARLFAPKLEQLEQAGFADLRAEVLRLTADTLLPDETRRALGELWGLQVEMKRHLDAPPGDYRNFQAEVLKMKTRHRDLVNSLLATVGIEGKPGPRPGLVPAPGPVPDRPAPPSRGGGAPDEPTLAVLDLSFRAEMTAGYVKVYGKVKNTSAQPLTGVTAIVRVRDARGIARAGLRARVVPEVIPPDGSASFFARAKLFSANDRYRVDFVTSDGRAIASTAPEEP